MTEITLPWPPSDLSPNARLHWAKQSKAKKNYRHACWAETLMANPPKIADAGKLRLELIFYRPTKRVFDRDNLLARMKSGLDGVSDALKINDCRFEPILVSVADDVGGFVKVRIFNEEEL